MNVAMRANCASAEFLSCMHHDDPSFFNLQLSIQTLDISDHVWTPPPPGHIKINFDAAWIRDTKSTGICAIARDCHGVMIDGSPLLCSSGSPLEAEAKAAVSAATLADHFPHDPIILESDSKSLIDYINNIHHACDWRIAPFISKIKNSISLGVRSSWIWIPRKVNSTADLVASLVVRKKCLEVWVDRPPSSLVHVLSRDGLHCPPILPPSHG